MKSPQVKTLIKIAVAIIAGVIISLLPMPDSLSKSAMVYMGCFVGMLVLMATRAVPDFVAVLVTCGALIVFNVGSIAGVFAPFGQSTIWTVITILMFAAGAQKGTVLYRLSLHILKQFPPTYTGQILAITSAIVVLNFLIPSYFVKVAILSTLVIGICDIFGYEKNSKPAVGFFSILFILCYHLGFGMTTAETAWAFMSGFMQTETIKPVYNFTSWLAGTWVWMIVLLIGTVAFVLVYNRPKETAAIGTNFVEDKLKELPPMDASDIKLIVILLVTILLWMTEGIHGISFIGITLGAVLAFFATGLLKTDDMLTGMSWTTILLIGGILSVAGLISPLGISTWVAGLMAPIAAPLMDNIALFVLCVCLIEVALRFVFVSATATIVMMIALFMPLCLEKGIHPFVLVYMLYSTSQCFTLSFNNILLQPMYPLTRDRLADYKALRPLSVVYVVLCILGLLASIPLWKAIGYLP